MRNYAPRIVIGIATFAIGFAAIYIFALDPIKVLRGSFALSSFDEQVNELIHKKCNFDGPCEISLREATDFDWDEMYVFRPGIVDGEAEQIVPAAKGFRGEFNRKIAFLKDGKLVKLDEAASIIEGEHTPPGMLFFDQELEGNPDALRYSRDTVFRVSLDKWIRGDVYQLVCANCSESPVFAEFGQRSRPTT